MKKLLALLLALLLVLSTLVACSPDDPDDGDLIIGGDGDDGQTIPNDGSDPAMPDVDWPYDLPLN